MSSKSRYTDALLQIGRAATVDIGEYSPQTQQSMKSHLKLFEANNIELTEEIVRTLDVRKMLDTMRNSKNKLLSDGYKRQVGITLQRRYPNIPLKLGKFNRTYKRSKATNSEFMTNIEKLTEQAAKYLVVPVDLLDLSNYNMCAVILLTTCTNLRINELLQLKMEHIPQILAGTPVNISTKGRRLEPRFITRSTLLDSVLKNIQLRRGDIRSLLDRALPNPWVEQQKTLEAAHHIILTSLSNMRKMMIEFATINGVVMPTYGFNMFRKYTTTLLVEGGGHKIAQMLNNHSSLNTTLNHYNVITAQAAENALRGLQAQADVNKLIKDAGIKDNLEIKNVQAKIEVDKLIRNAGLVDSNNAENIVKFEDDAMVGRG